MKNLILILALLIPAISNSQVPDSLSIKKQKTALTSFSYSISYDLDQVNKTRKSLGARDLKKNKYLDSCALERCKRMVKFIAQNPDQYVTSDSIFNIEGHNNMYKFGSENVTQKIEGAGVTKEKINELRPNEVYPLLTKGTFGPFLAGPKYDDSEGHKKNRTNPQWKEYGSCYLVVFVYAKNYNKSGMVKSIPTKIIIHYEMFR